MSHGRRENPIHTAAKRDAPCSTCGAAPGESCTNRKGGNAWPPHKARLDWSARATAEPSKPDSTCSIDLADLPHHGGGVMGRRRKRSQEDRP